MEISPDFKDLLSALNTEKVRYLVVGAYAVAFHAEPRYTKDLDIWIDPAPENARRVWSALFSFGAPIADTDPMLFTNPKIMLQIGIEPNRVDIIGDIASIPFENAWRKRIKTTVGGVKAYILGRGFD